MHVDFISVACGFARRFLTNIRTCQRTSTTDLYSGVRPHGALEKGNFPNIGKSRGAC